MHRIFVAYSLCLLLTLSIDIRRCEKDIRPSLNPFSDAITGEKETTTQAHICYDEEFIHIYWWSIDQQIISTYENCNDPLYNEDAVEIFLATPQSYPYRYFQFQVSPKGQLFFADIVNPQLTCGKLGTTYEPCTSAFYNANIDDKNKMWMAELKVALKIVGRGSIPKSLKGNIFRIDKSSNKPTRYIAYNPTLASPACFHKPLTFLDLNLI